MAAEPGGDAAPRDGAGPEPWERLESERLADYEIFAVRRVRSRSPRNGRVFDFHLIDVADWVNVVAFTADGRVVLVEQYRHGAGRVTLEFPSGVLDAGETPAAAARRELEEETGYAAAAVELVAELDPNPALQGNRLHVVRADRCAPGGSRSPDESEDLRVRVASPREVDELIRRGAIRHAHAIAAWSVVSSRTGRT
jgi:ADP-ribose pyrophosphatase